MKEVTDPRGLGSGDRHFARDAELAKACTAEHNDIHSVGIIQEFDVINTAVQTRLGAGQSGV
jgi:hypothetical protein